jgi:type VI secretion system secreted protein Hcp
MPIYLKVQGIDGEATEDQHKKWIEATSVNSPVARRVPEGSFGNDAKSKGALTFGNIEMSRKVDSSTIPLAKNAALGTIYTTVEIHVTTPLTDGEKNLIEYKLTNAIIVSHDVSVTAMGGGSSQSMDEHLSLNFSKIEWKYRKYKDDGGADGVVDGWYDRPTSKGG